jgi:branched-chain amino acid transport system ATP-binding protein
MSGEPPILRVEGVGKAFGGLQALLDVNFALYPTEILGIIGPNGSGKTTLVNLITGFVKLDSGKVWFRGREIGGWAPHRIADLGLTRTFQIMRPYYSLEAYRNLIVPLNSPRARRLGSGRYGERETVALDILEEIGFERDSFVPHKKAGTLPTGYLKRLELARCLALKPEIIIADELFSGLSASEIASLVPLIERLQMAGMTFIMVEHRLRELFSLAQRVMALDFGTKLTEGTPEEVMSNPRVREAYLGPGGGD